MAIHGLTLTALKTYISDLDPAKGKDEEACTKFKLGPVDSFVSGQIFDRGVDFSASGEAPRVNMSKMNTEYVRFGLRDFDNYVLESGPVAFATEDRFVAGKAYKVITEALLATFPRDLIQELGQEIKAMSTVSRDEAKNS